MNLIKLSHREDFGHEWYAQILNTGKHVPKPFKNWSLIQASVSWNDFPGWPYIKISSGTGSLLSIMFWTYKFGFDIGIIERTWDWGRLDQALEDFDSANGVA
ncbi:hypothetical protein SSZBM1_106 [Synechococcus phage S-SZBM1]|uniref:Uncharacterized protein n=1 Tax=Synechococcus phage S-SZBM1 TaxID=2926475 RepID=A0AC61TSM1_9CAUD|nr:hypothetical protein PP650_gp170 [Synechococcus phage S-SZBM1]UNH61223.1 hypothetical protein SSZBM1_106 [Synechococcus phage S-SZBM1]